MKTSILFFVFAFTIFFAPSVDLKAQVCRDLDTIIATPDTSFAVALSRTFKVNKKQPLVVVYTFYGKNDYYFAIAGEHFLGNLQLKLIETSNGKLLFDSSNEQYCTKKVITFDNTMNLSIQVLTPYWSYENGEECIKLIIGSRYSIVNNFDFFQEPGQ